MSSINKLLLGGIFFVILAATLFWVYGGNRAGVTLGGATMFGKLYLTLNPLGKAEPNIYVYNLADRSYKLLLDNPRMNTSPAVSPDGTQIAYMSKTTGEQDYQLYGMKSNGLELTLMTQDANAVKSHPAWSSDGTHVAYSTQAATATGNARLLTSNWFIFLTDTKKNSKLVGSGTNPFFSPDGKTLYALEVDGIASVPVADILNATVKKPPQLKSTGVEKGMLSTSSPAVSTMRISVSPDGKRLAWSMPSRKLVRIYSITSWAPLTLKVEHDLPLYAMDSVFSPDNSYLALEEVDMNFNKQLVNPRVVIYSLADYTSTQVADFSKYSTKDFSLSAWR